MKTLNLLTRSIAVGALLVSPVIAQAGILGSPHDFSAEAWNVKPGDQNTVCGTCHTPHGGDSSIVPLWSHATTTASFQMYNAANVATADLQMTPDAQPAGISKACLSCHDGTVAVNQYGGAGANGWGGTPYYITNSAKLGTDLTHTHPISMKYDPALVGNGANQDKWLWNPDTKDVLVPDNQPNFVPGNSMKVKDFLLVGDHRLECASCHDVHNQEGTPYDPFLNPSLVKIMGTQAGKGSLLCRSCHNK